MKRPSFQFYPADWRNNANLQRCSPAARGVWMDVLCVLHDSDEYGVARWPLVDLAHAAHAPIKLLRELVDKSVLKGHDEGPIDALIYVPRSGRRNGEPVALIPTQRGPLWYSSRMVRDEYVRNHTGLATRFGAGQGDGETPEGESPRHAPSRSPPRRHGDEQGDGATSSSSSSPSVKTLTPAPAGVGDSKAAAPPCPHQRVVDAYHELLPTAPAIREWNETRRGYLQSRWRERFLRHEFATQEEGVGWFRRFFGYVAKSAFLRGEGRPKPGQAPFVADLEWLLRPQNFVKVVEGKYHDEAEQ